MRFRAVALALAVLILGLLAVPVPVEAQKAGRVYRIGWLGFTNEVGQSDFTSRFELGLSDLGWVRQGNFVMVYRWAQREGERFPDLATELVQQKCDVIVAVGTAATRAAVKATNTIPIVFTLVADPVGSGFVTSLSRPGTNVTGVTDMLPELAGKQLELLKEAIPSISRVAVLWNPTDPRDTLIFNQITVAAQALGVRLQPLGVRGPDDLGPAFSAMKRERADALFVVIRTVEVGTGLGARGVLVQLALKNRLPAVSNSSALTRSGFLMSYAPKIDPMFGRAAVYVDKILRGSKPPDLPVERPTDFEFDINLKTAKALSLAIPQSVLIRADWVYQ